MFYKYHFGQTLEKGLGTTTATRRFGIRRANTDRFRVAVAPCADHKSTHLKSSAVKHQQPVWCFVLLERPDGST